MTTPAKRIDARQAHERVQSGDALLVCVYDSEEKFHRNHLEGAISWQEFQSQENAVPKDREIIFYCA
jgi:rhodanese-related sulfurtransferase